MLCPACCRGGGVGEPHSETWLDSGVPKVGAG